MPFAGANDLNREIISEDKNNLLKNPAFGSDENIKYYNQFNGIFNDPDLGDRFSNKIYAEELEMLAGFDANSLGFVNTDGVGDTLKTLFILDYVLESALYITVAQGIMKLQEIDNLGISEIKLKYKNQIKFTDTLKCISYRK